MLGVETGKEDATMATSSITENFVCNDPKAANTVVRLLFSEKVPKSWCVRVSSCEASPMTNEEERAYARRMRQRMAREKAGK